MDSTPTSEGSQPADGMKGSHHDPVPQAVDLVLGVIAGVIGLALTAVGIGVYTTVDRAVLQDVLTGENVRLEGITPAEAVTAGGPVIDWFAAGLMVTGAGLVVGAVAFVMLRRRTRRRVVRAGGTTATFWACTVYGGVVTVLLSFIPGSGIAGGAVAAYLHDDDPIRVGAVSGLVAAGVAVPVIVFLAAGFLAGAAAIGKLAGGALLVVVLVISQLLALAVGTALGAVGGFLSERFR